MRPRSLRLDIHTGHFGNATDSWVCHSTKWVCFCYKDAYKQSDHVAGHQNLKTWKIKSSGDIGNLCVA